MVLPTWQVSVFLMPWWKRSSAVRADEWVSSVPSWDSHGKLSILTLLIHPALLSFLRHVNEALKQFLGSNQHPNADGAVSDLSHANRSLGIFHWRKTESELSPCISAECYNPRAKAAPTTFQWGLAPITLRFCCALLCVISYNQPGRFPSSQTIIISSVCCAVHTDEKSSTGE